MLLTTWQCLVPVRWNNLHVGSTSHTNLYLKFWFLLRLFTFFWGKSVEDKIPWISRCVWIQIWHCCQFLKDSCRSVQQRPIFDLKNNEMLLNPLTWTSQLFISRLLLTEKLLPTKMLLATTQSRNSRNLGSVDRTDAVWKYHFSAPFLTWTSLVGLNVSKGLRGRSAVSGTAAAGLAADTKRNASASQLHWKYLKFHIELKNLELRVAKLAFSWLPLG